MSVRFSGNIGYACNDQNVTIRVSKVKNYISTLSGTLLLRLITSDVQYNGQNIIRGSQYDVIAQYRLEPLLFYFFYDNLELTLPIQHQFSRKYTVIVLNQYDGGIFRYVDWTNFEQKNSWNKKKNLISWNYYRKCQKNLKEPFQGASSCGRLGRGIYFTQKKTQAVKIGKRFNEPFAVIECEVKGHWKTDKHPDWVRIGYDFKQYCVPNNRYARIKKIHNT